MILVPDLVLDRDGVRRGAAVVLDGPRIGAVEPAGDLVGTSTPQAGHLERLAGVALLPGFVNGHSHAFQRDLRGRAEGGPGDFWSWREAMYALANTLDPDSIHDVSYRAYREMAAAGYTTVCEFHYVHHQTDGTPYGDPNAMAKAVVAAANDVGIRIVLLVAAYERARAGQPPEPSQRRFCDPSIAAYLDRVDALAAWAESRPTVDVGVAPHSVRAVRRASLEAIARHAAVNQLPIHVHVDEQRRDVDECRHEHGCRPVELLGSTGLLADRTTLVHATHSDEFELKRAADEGCQVCVCPTTEANLGDGWVPSERLVGAGLALAIGSDSNVIVDPFAELREIELSARRTSGRRGVVPLDVLWRAATPHQIVAGEPADLVAIDLDHPTIAGIADADLGAALVLAGTAGAVVRTWVAGQELRR